MLRFMPEWWHTFMVWLDTSFIPLWVVMVVFIAYFVWKFWREMEPLRHNPPPFD